MTNYLTVNIGHESLWPIVFPTPLTNTFLAMLLVLSLSGCSITQLQHTELQIPENLQSGQVYVEERATGFTGGRVGWGRVTVFSIPVVPIHIHSDEAIDLMQVVQDSLSTAGYAAHTAGSSQGEVVLAAHVNEVRFNNYTWFVPIIPTWGRISVTLTLESASGHVLWEKLFESKGTTYNFTDGYNIAATKIVTQLADNMVEAFTSLDFSQALAEGN
jgi:hypothetical protein